MEEKTIIALEIGSSKIKGAVGTVDPTSGALSVKAVEEERISDIVRYGCIRNVVETAAAVRNVVSRLEQREAPRKIERVYLSIGGRSLSSECVDIERRFATETEITKEIINDITEEAINRPLSDRIVIKALPRELRVDNAPTPRPVGMYGQLITARLNLVSCRNQLFKNLTEVIEGRLGLQVVDMFVRPLAEADLVLMSDERRLGCMLVDLGSETTTVAIYKDGVLVHLAVLPMGSRNITRDITSLNYLEERAEELKIAFGNAVPGAEQHSLRPADSTDMTAVNNYISARASEILLNVAEQIKYAGLTPDKLPDGIILVGRGSRLAGLNTRLEQILPGMKVRMGHPANHVQIRHRHTLRGRAHRRQGVPEPPAHAAPTDRPAAALAADLSADLSADSAGLAAARTDTPPAAPAASGIPVSPQDEQSARAAATRTAAGSAARRTAGDAHSGHRTEARAGACPRRDHRHAPALKAQRDRRLDGAHQGQGGQHAHRQHVRRNRRRIIRLISNESV